MAVQFQLRRRLACVARLVPPGSRVADIGSDHGRLPRILIGSGRAAFCLATELDPTRMANLRALPRDHPRAACLQFRAGFGLTPLRDEDRIDCVTITGLGARSMLEILDDGARRAILPAHLVLQPQSEPPSVRRWLARRGFGIVEERLVCERGRFYQVISARADAKKFSPAHPTLDLEDLHAVGPCLVMSGDPAVRQLWTGQFRRYRQVFDRLAPGAAKIRAARELDRARRILAALPQADVCGRPELQSRRIPLRPLL